MHFKAMSAAQIAGARVEIARTGRLFGTRLTNVTRQLCHRDPEAALAAVAGLVLAADGLAPAMKRLHKSCRRLIWLNPVLRWDGLEPKSQGIRALLPHVDEVRPVHNIDSLRALIAALSRPMPARGRPLEVAA